MPHERRVFVDLPCEFPACGNPEVSLSIDDSRHLTRVLRLKPGSPLTVVSRASGLEYQGLVVQAQARTVTVKIVSALSKKPRASLLDTLAFALSKGAKNDLVCEKACELGARRIIFWQAQRSLVPAPLPTEQPNRFIRWQKIAQAAAQQSARNDVPDVKLLKGVEKLVAAIKGGAQPADIFLCCSLSPAALPLRSLPAPRGRISVVIGPEGDLSAEEEEFLLRHGFKLVSLGPFVLRSETAAIAAAAAVQALWGV